MVSPLDNVAQFDIIKTEGRCGQRFGLAIGLAETRQPSPGRVAVVAFRLDLEHKASDMDRQSDRHTATPLFGERSQTAGPLM